MAEKVTLKSLSEGGLTGKKRPYVNATIGQSVTPKKFKIKDENDIKEIEFDDESKANQVTEGQEVNIYKMDYDGERDVVIANNKTLLIPVEKFEVKEETKPEEPDTETKLKDVNVKKEKENIPKMTVKVIAISDKIDVGSCVIQRVGIKDDTAEANLIIFGKEDYLDGIEVGDVIELTNIVVDKFNIKPSEQVNVRFTFKSKVKKSESTMIEVDCTSSKDKSGVFIKLEKLIEFSACDNCKVKVVGNRCENPKTNCKPGTGQHESYVATSKFLFDDSEETSDIIMFRSQV